MLGQILSTRKMLFLLGVVALVIGMAFLTAPVSAQSFESTEGLLVIHVTYELDPEMLPPSTKALITNDFGKPITGRINPDGYFSVLLPPGSYSLNLSAKGFTPFAEKFFTIRVGETTTISAYMNPTQ